MATVFLILALGCFVLAAFGLSPGIGLIPLGLAFTVAAKLVGIAWTPKP